MKTNKIIIFTTLFLQLFIATALLAQEHKGPLVCNPELFNKNAAPQQAQKKTALSLPFFEDFTSYDLYPDAAKWVENQVYINNTMCVSPVSRGVATFDALNPLGLPWNPFSNSAFNFADSLTSKPIDLSTYSAADSLYLSFFYQPQGNGFYPLRDDSFMLFLRDRYGNFKRTWKIEGSSVQPFTQVMIPITDSLYFHNNFQFRFVNIAALNYSDAIWNLDYIRLDAHRNIGDTAIGDVGFSSSPTFLLNDYTAMPYRQFYANPSAERASSYKDSVHNLTSAQTITHHFSATDLGSGTVLQAPTTATATLPATSTHGLTNTAYTTTVSPGSAFQKVVFENKFWFESTTGTGTLPNDTIVKQQVFDNYLAYDDGSAEQSYYITLLPTLPGKISIEYHLNVPDTMQGMAIYFGRQVPSASYKSFDIQLYSSLAGVNGASADHLIYQQYDCNPGYPDTINHFWVYKFETPVPLPAGTFYAGVFMPAESGDDSLYFGLDMNRIGGNHAYYNVLATWSPSTIQGAIMMRPLLGQNITSSHITDAAVAVKKTWSIAPNPAYDEVNVYFPGDDVANYTICNLQGQTVLSGKVTTGAKLDVSKLPAGMYLVNVYEDGVAGVPQKLIKL